LTLNADGGHLIVVAPPTSTRSDVDERHFSTLNADGRSDVDEGHFSTLNADGSHLIVVARQDGVRHLYGVCGNKFRRHFCLFFAISCCCEVYRDLNYSATLNTDGRSDVDEGLFSTLNADGSHLIVVAHQDGVRHPYGVCCNKFRRHFCLFFAISCCCEVYRDLNYSAPPCASSSPFPAAARSIATSTALLRLASGLATTTPTWF
jgi:hypothetical protein